MWLTITGFVAKAIGALSPISDLLKGWKTELFIFLAYRRGKKAGREEVVNENIKETLDDVTKVSIARNDPAMREFVRKKYIRDE